MNLKLSFLAFFSFCLIATAQTTVNLSLDPSYANEVYYKFSTNQSYDHTATDWEIAFLRNNNMNFAIRINDGIGLEVFEAANTPADYATVDVNNVANFTQLYNSDISWFEGAFNTGSASYGFGEYNPANHHVEGTVTFLLKYADGSFKKLFIEDYFGGYTFKYATWDETTSTWSVDTTETVSNTSNPNNMFNYYNFTTATEVVAEPASTDWDLKFTKFTTDYAYSGGTMKYVVTGALQHPDLVVAENIEPNGNGDTSNLNYSDEINTIGYDWKTLNASYTYDVEPDLYFYVKYLDGTVYKLHFTNFGGSSSGDVEFTFEDVTSQLNTVAFDAENSFSIYPNPSSDKQINVLVESEDANQTVEIYNLLGKKVYTTQLQNAGFTNQRLNLSQLANGSYIVKYQAGSHSTTQKLILN